MNTVILANAGEQVSWPDAVTLLGLFVLVGFAWWVAWK